MSAEPDDNWIFDSLVNFLHGNIWKIPVLGFIEDKSVVFDPDSHANLTDQKEEEFQKIHEEYKALVDYMLSSFMDDIQVTPSQVEEACQQREKMSNFAESHITKIALEQLQAAEDFTVFRRIMTRKNIDLQLQSLELLVAKYGVLSPSLRSGAELGDNGEDDFLQVVIRYCDDSLLYDKVVPKSAKGKKENISCTLHESTPTSTELKEAQDITKLDLIQGSKYVTGSHEKKQTPPPHPHLPQSLAQLDRPKQAAQISIISSQLIQQDLEDSEKGPGQDTAEASEKLADLDLAPEASTQVPSTRMDVKGRKKEHKSVKFDETTVAEIATIAPEQHRILTSVRRALEVSTDDSTHEPEAVSMMLDMTGSEEDIEKRSAYLRAQRDKLVALRKRERERQLEAVAGGSQERPKSARAAQMAMRSPPSATNKSLAARLALAARLKHELLDK